MTDGDGRRRTSVTSPGGVQSRSRTRPGPRPPPRSLNTNHHLHHCPIQVPFKLLYSRLSLLVISREISPSVHSAVVWYLTGYYGTSVTLGFLVLVVFLFPPSLPPSQPRRPQLRDIGVPHLTSGYTQGSYIVLSLQPSREHPVTKGKATRNRLRPSSTLILSYSMSSSL